MSTKCFRFAAIFLLSFISISNLYAQMQIGPGKETEPNNNTSQANAINYSDSLTASISYYNDNDYYKFIAEKGDTVDISAQSMADSELEGQIQLLVLVPNWSVLAKSAMNPTDLKSQRVVYVIDSPGTYYIRYSYRNYPYYAPEAGINAKNAGHPVQASAESGSYWIRLKKFRPSAPVINYTSSIYSDHNAICLNFNISPNGSNTSVKLEYGLTSSYGNTINITPEPVNSIQEKALTYIITGLQPATEYHYRLTIENSYGKAAGADNAVSTINQPEGWTHEASGITGNLYGISFADQNTGLAAGLNGKILKTTDGGKTWTEKNSGTSNNLYSVTFAGQNTAYAAGAVGTIIKTTDQGETWKTVKSTFYDSFTGIAFYGDVGVAVGSPYFSWTGDGGSTWWTQEANGDFQSVAFLDEYNAIAVSREGKIKRSTNMGSTWLTYVYSPSYKLRSVAFRDPVNGIAAGGGTIMKTTDGGKSWAINTRTENINAVAWTGENTVIAACDNGVMLLSADGGVTWNPMNSGTTANLYAVCSVQGNTHAAGVGGKIVRYGGSYIRVVSPNGGENWNAGKTRQIKWVSSDVASVKIELTTDNGANWSVITGNTAAGSGSYSWTIPAISSSPDSSSFGQCRIRISSAYGPDIKDISDNVFSLSPNPEMTEMEPNNSRETSNLLEYGDSLNASVGSPDDADYYRFTALPNDTVDILSVNRNNSMLQGKFLLLDAEGNQLESSKNFTDSLSQRIVFTLSKAGTYYIKYTCRYPLSNTGDYRIILKRYKVSAPTAGYVGAVFTSCNTINTSIHYCSNGAPAWAILEYGTSKDYGTSVDLNIYSGTYYECSGTYLITGLLPDTWYHFRLKLINYAGTTISQDYTIKTWKAPENWDLYNRPDLYASYSADFWDQNTGVAAGYGGIAKTTDGGKTWSQATNYVTLYGIAVSGSGSAVAVGPHSAIERLANANGYWQEIYPPQSCDLYTVGFLSQNIAIAAGDNIILRSADGGASWVKINYTGSTYPNNFNCISTIDQSCAFLLTKDGKLFKTADAGLTWIELQQPTAKSTASVSFIDRNNGMIAGNDVMLKTTDGGVTWKEVFLQDTTRFGDIRSVKYADQNTIIAAGSLGKVYVSIDRGKTWKPQQTGTPLRFNNIAMAGSLPIIAGEGGIFLKSTGIDMIAWKEKITISDGGNTNGSYTNRGYANGSYTNGNYTNRGNTNGGNNNSQALYIGCSVAASDGIDQDLGEYTLPPMPPIGGFDARLKLPEIAPGIPGDQSLLDYRNDSLKTINWIISFQAGTGGNPITITWDPALLPDGSFYLKDNVNGSVININMKAQSSYTMLNPEINTLKIEFHKMLTSSISLSKGWNISSVPVIMTDMTSSTLFPEASAPVYGFMNGYQTSTILETAKGYWVRYTESKVINISGTASAGSSAIPISAGWNLIGPYDYTVQTSSITTTPSGILTSPFYSFMSSYQIPSILEPGKGYWIRSSQAGTLNLGGKVEAEAESQIPTVSGVESNPDKIGTMKSGVKVKEKILAQSGIKDTWGKLIVEDNIGNRGVLYISNDKENLSLYDLPPMPPSGIFDIRYSTDRIVENINKSSAAIKISSANYPITFRSEGMDIRLKDKIDGHQLNVTLSSGTSVTIQNSSIDNIQIDPVEIPLTYELKQNYPNPFNPQTTISYSIPEKTHLRIIIYNQLGETVEELINSPQDPGNYKITWKPARYASGIYFLHMETDSYKQTIKMLYLK